MPLTVQVQTHKPPTGAIVRPPAKGTHHQRGYTLVELMIAVSIVGVLAALAMYGVRAYVASSKTAEAKQKVGIIAQHAVAAYERERSSGDAVALGVHDGANHQLCQSSTWVPAEFAKVQGTKYQPNSADGEDFQVGNDTSSWKCLRFHIDEPIYYQYHYEAGGTGDWSGVLTGDYFVAQARGDTDADGTAALFQRGGRVDAGEITITLQTLIWMSNETE
jgi:type IV pilus assembly protein PilA